MSKQSLESLFKELDNFIQESEFDAALDICDKSKKKPKQKKKRTKLHKNQITPPPPFSFCV